jgi:hypothetical protein
MKEIAEDCMRRHREEEAASRESSGARIRPIEPEDVAFVICSWLEGYWDDGPFELVMPKSQWWRRWHVVIENILADERCKTLIACNPENEEQLYGFVSARPPDILHWVYVKQPYRGNGIAKELELDAGLRLPFRLSHWSSGADRMSHHEGDAFYYDPRIIKEYA